MNVLLVSQNQEKVPYPVLPLGVEERQEQHEGQNESRDLQEQQTADHAAEAAVGSHGSLRCFPSRLLDLTGRRRGT